MTDNFRKVKVSNFQHALKLVRWRLGTASVCVCVCAYLLCWWQVQIRQVVVLTLVINTKKQIKTHMHARTRMHLHQ